MTRKEVDTIGSPVYQIPIRDLLITERQQHDMDIGVYRKYVPYDYISILNTNAVSYELILNDVHHFAIPASASVTYSDIAFRRFTIVATGGALTGADMFVSVQHMPVTADKAARKPKGLMDYIPLAGFLMR